MLIDRLIYFHALENGEKIDLTLFNPKNIMVFGVLPVEFF